ncbi:MAG TPA: hypothetical protein PLQ36_04435, partial [Candidatus Gracilibacteria bacterium]|nr:hypothetical protein [Candidatus Gracilibacteria bacterium]
LISNGYEPNGCPRLPYCRTDINCEINNQEYNQEKQKCESEGKELTYTMENGCKTNLICRYPCPQVVAMTPEEKAAAEAQCAQEGGKLVVKQNPETGCYSGLECQKKCENYESLPIDEELNRECTKREGEMVYLNNEESCQSKAKCEIARDKIRTSPTFADLSDQEFAISKDAEDFKTVSILDLKARNYPLEQEFYPLTISASTEQNDLIEIINPQLSYNYGEKKSLDFQFITKKAGEALIKVRVEDNGPCFGDQCPLIISHDLAWKNAKAAGEVNKKWLTMASDASGKILLAGAHPGLLYLSIDSGETWKVVNQKSNKFWSVTAISADGNTLFAGIL